MTAEAELRTAIVAAKQAGHTAELRRLQARYRTGKFPVNSAERGQRSSPVGIATAGHRAAAPSSLPGLPHEGSRPTVILSQLAFQSIKTMRNGAEDAGWLVGPPRQSVRAIELRRSIWSAKEADRSATSVKIDLDELRYLDDLLGNEEHVWGHWHSQPTSSEPSPTDYRTWSTMLAELKREVFVGIVVKDRLVGAVDIRAFAVFREENGITVHCPAHLELRS